MSEAVTSCTSSRAPLDAVIHDLLDGYHAAAANGDFDAYFGAMHPEGRFLGTDKTENWTVTEFQTFCRPYFKLGQAAWVYIPILDSRKIDYFPSASSPILATFDELLEARSFGCTARGTGSIVFDSATNKWLIIHYYLSFPVPNDLAKDICKKIGMFEKKQSLATYALNSSSAADADATADWLSDVPVVKANAGKGKNGKKK